MSLGAVEVSIESTALTGLASSGTNSSFSVLRSSDKIRTHHCIGVRFAICQAHGVIGELPTPQARLFFVELRSLTG